MVWDELNKGHIRKHKVRQEEVEEVCRGVLKSQPTYGQRILVFGETKKKRKLTAVLAKKKAGIYYVVTARNASKKERGRFFK